MERVRGWKLGEDLHEKDNLLDGVTIDDLILAVHCNCPDITPDMVRRTFAQIMEIRLIDAQFIMEMNMNEIMRRAAEGRSLQ